MLSVFGDFNGKCDAVRSDKCVIEGIFKGVVSCGEGLSRIAHKNAFNTVLCISDRKINAGVQKKVVAFHIVLGVGKVLRNVVGVGERSVHVEHGRSQKRIGGLIVYKHFIVLEVGKTVGIETEFGASRGDYSFVSVLNLIRNFNGHLNGFVGIAVGFIIGDRGSFIHLSCKRGGGEGLVNGAVNPAVGVEPVVDAVGPVYGRRVGGNIIFHPNLRLANVFMTRCNIQIVSDAGRKISPDAVALISYGKKAVG